MTYSLRVFSGLLCGGFIALSACTSAQSAGDDSTSTEQGWDAESATNEAQSTHLWIVNQAIRILDRHKAELPIAARAVKILNDEGCRTQWQRGLLDADFKAEYNNGRRDLSVGASDLEVGLSGATWESHFWDPDTGLNYKGTPKTALTEANRHLDAAFANATEVLLHQGTTEAQLTACYEYGLSLHYFTDLTQPMHAANFTAVNRPAKLHSNLEGYAVTIQSRYGLADWSTVPSGDSNQFIEVAARTSKNLWPESVRTVVDAYHRNRSRDFIACGLIDANPARFLVAQEVDHKKCWENDAKVDAMVGKALTQAQDLTAQYIYLATAKLPAGE